MQIVEQVGADSPAAHKQCPGRAADLIAGLVDQPRVKIQENGDQQNQSDGQNEKDQPAGAAHTHSFIQAFLARSDHFLLSFGPFTGDGLSFHSFPRTDKIYSCIGGIVPE
jgi:hypothetical protein